MCRVCYFHIRPISRVRKFLSQQTCFLLCSQLLGLFWFCARKSSHWKYQQASKCSKLCCSPRSRHEERRTHHCRSETNPLAAYLVTNSWQAVSSLLQKHQHSPSFISLWSSQSVQCLSHSALCRRYNQAVCPTLSAQEVRQACFFQICSFSLELTALLISVKLTPHTFSKLTSKLTFSAPSRPLCPAWTNWMELSMYASLCLCASEWVSEWVSESVCVIVCVCLCVRVCVCVCVCLCMCVWVWMCVCGWCFCKICFIDEIIML